MEKGLAGVEDFRGTDFDLETVTQFGPLIRVGSAHGDYVFLSSSFSFGAGGLIGSKQFTYAWDTGIGE